MLTEKKEEIISFTKAHLLNFVDFINVDFL